MSLINIKNLSFCYDKSYDYVFKDTTIQIDSDWKLGLVGRNGKGKTTLLNLLLGKYEFSGKIETNLSFDYFPFDVISPDDLVIDVIENAVIDYQLWKVKKELALLKVDDEVLYRQFSSLSKGEQTKIMIVILFLKENNFLLIDEPTNHLDRYGREILSTYLSKKKSYILVSHDRSFLDNCIDHVLSINKCSIEIIKGSFSDYLQEKENQDKFEIAKNLKLQGEIERLKGSSRQSSDWSGKAESAKYGGKQESGLRPDRGFIGAKAAKVMKKAKVIEKRYEKSIEEKAGLLKNIDRVDTLKILAEDYHSEILLVAKDLVIKYGDKIVSKPINLEIKQGERVSLIGRNGSGKSSFLKAILKQNIEHDGQLIVASNLKLSYVPQDSSTLAGSINDFCSEFRIDKTKLFTILNKLGFEKSQFDKRIEEFSEGQKKKLLIAKSLSEEANLFIWDEPLNYIDIISRRQIEDLLSDTNIAIVFVEHDKVFCDKISTKHFNFDA